MNDKGPLSFGTPTYMEPFDDTARVRERNMSSKESKKSLVQCLFAYHGKPESMTEGYMLLIRFSPDYHNLKSLMEGFKLGYSLDKEGPLSSSLADASQVFELGSAEILTGSGTWFHRKAQCADYHFLERDFEVQLLVWTYSGANPKTLGDEICTTLRWR